MSPDIRRDIIARGRTWPIRWVPSAAGDGRLAFTTVGRCQGLIITQMLVELVPVFLYQPIRKYRFLSKRDARPISLGGGLWFSIKNKTISLNGKGS
jgi:hypothetical protein